MCENPKCKTCGLTRSEHGPCAAARCETHRLEAEARAMYSAAFGLLSGATAEQYATKRSEVHAAARRWLEAADTESQRQQASATVAMWSLSNC